ncbi:hypothetical protein [Thalassotalea atypica]|uniref:hypothetical protein n=1 Tax=Thalassotalea atypica TaxID=2054316 RepID=UPI002572B07F|nr:hypothetical protein [Thalassotalea atypica]
MKKIFTTAALLCLSATTLAAQTTPQNLIVRPLTLADGEFNLFAGAVYGEQSDDDKKWQILPGIAYGITDNLTLGFGGLTYQLLDRPSNGYGLELSTSIHYAGSLEVKGADDTDGIGFDITGKYVLSKDTAVLFSTEYVHWDEEVRDNRYEIRYSIGVQQNVYNDVSVFANYTYSDLHDFSDSSANAGTIGVNYAYSKSVDLGVAINYSDFDAIENGYKADNVFEKSVALYVSKRF